MVCVYVLGFALLTGDVLVAASACTALALLSIIQQEMLVDDITSRPAKMMPAKRPIMILVLLDLPLEATAAEEDMMTREVCCS